MGWCWVGVRWNEIECADRQARHKHIYVTIFRGASSRANLPGNDQVIAWWRPGVLVASFPMACRPGLLLASWRPSYGLPMPSPAQTTSVASVAFLVACAGAVSFPSLLWPHNGTQAILLARCAICPDQHQQTSTKARRTGQRSGNQSTITKAQQ